LEVGGQLYASVDLNLLGNSAPHPLDRKLGRPLNWSTRHEEEKQSRRITYSVLQFFKEETKFGELQIPLSKVQKETTGARRLSKSTVQNIAK
jgi:hypothetical protein